SVMLDSDESGVTYTKVSSPFEGLSDIGSPRGDDHEYLELPWMPEDPYVKAALQASPSLYYVPGPDTTPPKSRSSGIVSLGCYFKYNKQDIGNDQEWTF
ncbi:hypothetical protein Tco_0293803, partial [Tanacetum coccineum]